jgi:hypothetical protein
LVPRTHTFYANCSRLNDGRQNGLKGSASKEPISGRHEVVIILCIAENIPCPTDGEMLLKRKTPPITPFEACHGAVGWALG